MYGWRVLMCLSVYMFHFPPLFLCWDFFCVVDELQFSESVCRSPTVASNREQPQPRQHTTSCHQCNKAQTKLITCFSAFSHPSLQISSHQGATWHYYYCVLLILCLFLTHSLLQFPILCLAPTHLSYLSPLLSSPSVSLCVSLSVLQTLFPVVFRGSLVSFSLRVTWLRLGQEQKKNRTQWILAVFFN